MLGFLSARNDRLFGFDPSNDDLAFATPRSWEMVSNILNNVNSDPEAVYPMIAGLIGSGAAIEFRSWCRVYSELPDMDDLFNGRPVPVPKSTDTIYATVSSMTTFAREHKKDLIKIGHSLNYAKQLPAEYSALLIFQYKAIEKDFEKVLQRIPEYFDLARTKGTTINGYI